MAKVTIDGHEVEVPAGTTVLRAAKQVGVDVPVFCYHPGLSIAANCRMCLVEIEKAPKPLPACYTEVADGMVVRTRTEKIQETQKSVLEFILLNHPVDCPICDQAGECVLQEHFVTWSAKPSRLFHNKVGKAKAKILGPTVVLDAERCVVCTRCVRFCDEVTKTHELCVEDRGEHSEITTAPHTELANDYSLNVVDICPVGALTSRDFRFRRRVWFLDQRDTVCTGCARGCSIRLDSHANKVERLLPRYNPDVNGYWMCDAGRKSLDSRTTAPMVLGRVPGPNDAVREAPALDGLRAISAWLQAARQNGGRVGVALSASLSCEDLYAWAKLAVAVGAKTYLLRRAPWQGDDLLRAADRDANFAGAKAILDALVPDHADLTALAADAAGLDTLIVLDNEVAASDELLEAVASVQKSAVLTDLAGAVSEAATVVVPLASLHSREGTIVNTAGWVQRLAAPLKPAVTTVAPHVAAAILGQGLGQKGGEEVLDFTDRSRPAQIFDRIAATVPAFQHLSYAEIADLGRGLTSGGELQPRRARVDGTQQWEPDPVAPTFKRPFAIRRGA